MTEEDRYVSSTSYIIFFSNCTAIIKSFPNNEVFSLNFEYIQMKVHNRKQTWNDILNSVTFMEGVY